jgi:hypothetical protein
MAGGTVPTGEITWSGTLAASTVDTVQFADRGGYVLVENTGSGVIYASADGTTPVTSGAGTSVAIVAGASALLGNGNPTWYQSSKVIPAGTTQYPNGSGVYQTTPNGQPGQTVPFMSSGVGKAANPGTTVKLVSSGTPTYTVTLS